MMECTWRTDPGDRTSLAAQGQVEVIELWSRQLDQRDRAECGGDALVDQPAILAQGGGREIVLGMVAPSFEQVGHCCGGAGEAPLFDVVEERSQRTRGFTFRPMKGLALLTSSSGERIPAQVDNELPDTGLP